MTFGDSLFRESGLSGRLEFAEAATGLAKLDSRPVLR